MEIERKEKENNNFNKKEKEEDYVCPGQRIGHVEDFINGEGTYIRNQYIHASVVGYKIFQPSKDKNSKMIIHVIKEREPTIVPELHNIVTCRVKNIL